MDSWLAGAWIDPAVALLRPDYQVALVTAGNLVPGPSDPVSDELLAKAVAAARGRLAGQPAETLPHLRAWREAFRAFGAKPQRTRPSVEALLRRLDAGLPRIDRLTDAYNAISIEHLLPVGGEDLDHYTGPIRLVRADGTEPFDTTSDGQPVTERAEPSEVVWRDDLGVTCRRWNWRQCTRTRLGEATTKAVFVLDSLAPMTSEELAAAAAALGDALLRLSPAADISTRYLSARDAGG